MIPGNGKGRPRQGDRIPSNVQNLDNQQTTPRRRQKPPGTPVLAKTIGVVGGTGRHRWLLVYRCPLGCGAHHVAHGRGDLPPGIERPAACGRGRVLIIPCVEQRGAA